MGPMLPALLIAVFVGLALLHVFWALGGRTGWLAALPEVDGRPAFVPSARSAVAVAIVLLLFALLVAAKAGWAPLPIPFSVLRGLNLALALVFLLRAIGDFRLVGFSKRVRGTRFARMDDAVYSPLCVAFCLGVLVVALRPPA